MTEEALPTEDTTSEDDNQQLRLINVLYSLESQISRQASLKFAFLRGAVYGVGTVVGATLLIAIFGSILASTIDSLSEVPFIGRYIDEGAGQQYLND